MLRSALGVVMLKVALGIVMYSAAQTLPTGILVLLRHIQRSILPDAIGVLFLSTHRRKLPAAILGTYSGHRDRRRVCG